MSGVSEVMSANLLIFKTVIAGDSWGEVAVPMIREFPLALVIFMGLLSPILRSSALAWPIVTVPPRMAALRALAGSHLTIVFGVLNLVVAVVVDTFAEQRTKDVTNMAMEP